CARRLLHALHDGRHLRLGQVTTDRAARSLRPPAVVRAGPRVTAAAEHLAGLLPALAERVAGGRDVRAEEAVAEVVEVIAPPWPRGVEMTEREQHHAGAEVVRDLEDRAARRATFDRAAEPRGNADLHGADEAAGHPRETIAETVELLHGRVMPL